MAKPTYEATPAISNYGYGNVIPNRFVILEFQDDKAFPVCTMSNHGDRLNNLLKRGIPMAEARKLFYQMEKNEKLSISR